MDKLPLEYTNSAKAWMTSTLFENWFHHTFVPAVRSELKAHKMEPRAVLLLDNCPAHPPEWSLTSKDGKITVKYLPKSTTSLCQPLDQGIIACFKAYYRKNLVRNMLEEDTTVTTFLKSFTLKDALWVSAKSWDSVTWKTIVKCWDKGLPNTHQAESDDEDEDDAPLFSFNDPTLVAAVTKTMPDHVEEAGSVEELMSS
jgi:hypothetical protein